MLPGDPRGHGNLLQKPILLSSVLTFIESKSAELGPCILCWDREGDDSKALLGHPAPSGYQPVVEDPFPVPGASGPLGERAGFCLRARHRDGVGRRHSTLEEFFGLLHTLGSGEARAGPSPPSPTAPAGART